MSDKGQSIEIKNFGSIIIFSNKFEVQLKK